MAQADATVVLDYIAQVSDRLDDLKRAVQQRGCSFRMRPLVMQALGSIEASFDQMARDVPDGSDGDGDEDDGGREARAQGG